MSGFQATCHVPARNQRQPAWWLDDHVSDVPTRLFVLQPLDTAGIRTASVVRVVVHDTGPEASVESFSDVPAFEDPGRSGQGSTPIDAHIEYVDQDLLW